MLLTVATRANKTAWELKGKPKGAIRGTPQKL